MADATMLNLEKVIANLKKVTPAAEAAAGKRLKTEAADMVTAIKQAMDAAYEGQNDKGLKTLQESVHDYPNPNRELSEIILADAKDAKGKFIGSNVEAGHRTVDGGHVAARPAFYPTYRARKKGVKARIAQDVRAAIKQTSEG